MNYIYDIVLNFQENYYQFFEWNRTDKIKNISKISVYHITDEDLLILKDNQVIIDNDFLSKIKEDNPKHKKIICLVSNLKQTIGLQISEDGTILKRSSLLFEEEQEVNDFCKTLPLTKIHYIQNIAIPQKNILRLEREKKDTLIEYLNRTNDIVTLKYLYYEYFKKECQNSKKMKQILLQELEKEWNQNQNKLYQIIKLLNKKSSTLKKIS